MKIVTPNSNIVKNPNPIKHTRTHDNSVMPPIPEKVIKRSKNIYDPIVKTPVPNF